MAEIKKLPLRLLKENPLNSERSMDYAEIKNLKESIMEVGLLHPLVVYENGDAEGTYTIVSGHKRYSALLDISGPGGQAMCNVITKPETEIKEGELMARANVHRSTPEEIRTEVKIVNAFWNTMPKERRKYWTDRLLTEFEEKNKDNPDYKKDPDSFRSNRFRPRLDYINQITCLGVSNRTLTKYLKDTILKDEGEGFAEKEKKEKKITVANIKRAAESLAGMLDAYEYESAKPEYIEQLQEALEDTLAQIESLKKL